MIRGTDLTRAFADDVVLAGVSIHVRRGDVLGIIGAGGVGKSLLLKMLCGLVEPDSGTIEVGGEPIAELDTVAMARVREQFGMLFQNYALFDFMTVGENVAFPLEQRRELPPDEIHARVAARLLEVDLPGTERLFPSELSGGMKKRVALARATIAQAPLLLYDDPTAGLDPVTSSKIFKLIERLHSDDGATVIVGHDVDRMAAVCKRWLLLHEREVHFRGTTAEALASTDDVVSTFFEGVGSALGPGGGP